MCSMRASSNSHDKNNTPNGYSSSVWHSAIGNSTVIDSMNINTLVESSPFFDNDDDDEDNDDWKKFRSSWNRNIPIGAELHTRRISNTDVPLWPVTNASFSSFRLLVLIISHFSFVCFWRVCDYEYCRTLIYISSFIQHLINDFLSVEWQTSSTWKKMKMWEKMLAVCLRTVIELGWGEDLFGHLWILVKRWRMNEWAVRKRALFPNMEGTPQNTKLKKTKKSNTPDTPNQQAQRPS